MKKNYEWKVTVDGEDYLVRCVPYKTVFDVYVDEELAIRVPRRNEEGTDMEEDVKVGSKVCRFVVYDGEPDLAVDGILMGVEADMRRKEIRNRLLLVFGGIATACVSSFAMFLWFVFEAAGKPLFGGFVTPVFITVFILGGLAMVFFGLKPNKRY